MCEVYLFANKAEGIFDHRVLQSDRQVLLLPSCRASQEEVQHSHNHHRSGHKQRERLQDKDHVQYRVETYSFKKSSVKVQEQKKVKAEGKWRESSLSPSSDP